MRRVKSVDKARLSFQVEFSQNALLAGAYADPVALAVEITYQTQIIEAFLSNGRVIRAGSPQEAYGIVNEIESDPQAFAVIKGEGNAVAAKALLTHLTLLGKTRTDLAQRPLENTLIVFIKCGQANNECFRDTIGLTR